jgi:hypothetical protein
MAAPMGPASHEMMNPAVVSSRRKTISHPGLSAASSDPFVVTCETMRDARVRSVGSGPPT